MKTNSLWKNFALTLAAGGLALGAVAAEPKKVLIVNASGPGGFRHSSITIAEQTITQLGVESGLFTVVDSARQPTLKVPQKPNPPQKVKELAADADDKAKAKYQADLAKYETAQKKFEADLAAFDPAKVKLAWELNEVPDVAHSAEQMSRAAARTLYGKK